MPKLMILDDDPTQRASIVEAALEAGFRVGDITDLGSLEEAEQHLEDPVEIAVIDLNLGNGLEEAGVDFISRLHVAQPDCKIIALTTKQPDGAGVRALAYGACDFISSKWVHVNWKVLLRHKLEMYLHLVQGTVFA